MPNGPERDKDDVVDPMDFEAPLGPPIGEDTGDVPASLLRDFSATSFLSGDITPGPDSPYVEPTSLAGVDVDNLYKLTKVQEICDNLAHLLDNMRATYVERFVEAVRDNEGDPDVAKIMMAARKIEQQTGNPAPYGVGLLAIEMLGKAMRETLEKLHK